MIDEARSRRRKAKVPACSDRHTTAQAAALRLPNYSRRLFFHRRGGSIAAAGRVRPIAYPDNNGIRTREWLAILRIQHL